MVAPILEYFDVILRHEDVALLEEGNWLDDTIIDFYMEYLERNTLRNFDEILMFRPGMVHLVTETPDPVQLKDVLPPGLNLRRAIFIPINDARGNTADSGSHWSLLLYLKDQGTFYCFDSLSNANSSSAQHAMQKFYALLRPTQKLQWMSVPTPQQTNDADCGVFVISIMDTLIARIMSPQPVTAQQLVTLTPQDISPPSQTRASLRQLVANLVKVARSSRDPLVRAGSDVPVD